jgi:hypothetical protein
LLNEVNELKSRMQEHFRHISNLSPPKSASKSRSASRSKSCDRSRSPVQPRVAKIPKVSESPSIHSSILTNFRLNNTRASSAQPPPCLKPYLRLRRRLTRGKTIHPARLLTWWIGIVSSLRLWVAIFTVCLCLTASFRDKMAVLLTHCTIS